MSDYFSGGQNRALAGAVARLRLSSSEEDKCNRKHSRKGRFSAEMNVLGYIREHGENKLLNWWSQLRIVFHRENSAEMAFISDGILEETISSGVWTRERQREVVIGMLTAWLSGPRH